MRSLPPPLFPEGSLFDTAWSSSFDSLSDTSIRVFWYSIYRVYLSQLELQPLWPHVAKYLKVKRPLEEDDKNFRLATVMASIT